MFGLNEVASGEDEALVKVKRPEDKRKRAYHHPDDRMIHYQYGRYQMAPGAQTTTTTHSPFRQTMPECHFFIFRVGFPFTSLQWALEQFFDHMSHFHFPFTA
jgi:hypothetical protein